MVVGGWPNWRNPQGRGSPPLDPPVQGARITSPPCDCESEVGQLRALVGRRDAKVGCAERCHVGLEQCETTTALTQRRCFVAAEMRETGVGLDREESFGENPVVGRARCQGPVCGGVSAPPEGLGEPAGNQPGGALLCSEAGAAQRQRVLAGGTMSSRGALTGSEPRLHLRQMCQRCPAPSPAPSQGGPRRACLLGSARRLGEHQCLGHVVAAFARIGAHVGGVQRGDRVRHDRQHLVEQAGCDQRLGAIHDVAIDGHVHLAKLALRFRELMQCSGDIAESIEHHPEVRPHLGRGERHARRLVPGAGLLEIGEALAKPADVEAEEPAVVEGSSRVERVAWQQAQCHVGCGERRRVVTHLVEHDHPLEVHPAEISAVSERRRPFDLGQRRVQSPSPHEGAGEHRSAAALERSVAHSNGDANRSSRMRQAVANVVQVERGQRGLGEQLGPSAPVRSRRARQQPAQQRRGLDRLQRRDVERGDGAPRIHLVTQRRLPPLVHGRIRRPCRAYAGVSRASGVATSAKRGWRTREWSDGTTPDGSSSWSR